MSVLRLNSNEGPRAPQELLAELAALDPEVLRRYPDATAVETALAARAGVSAERVVVTAGADEALDRIFRSYSGPDRPVLLPEPTFDMLERFAALAGAPVVRVPWLTDAFPLEEILARHGNRGHRVAQQSDRRRCLGGRCATDRGGGAAVPRADRSGVHRVRGRGYRPWRARPRERGRRPHDVEGMGSGGVPGGVRDWELGCERCVARRGGAVSCRRAIARSRAGSTETRRRRAARSRDRGPRGASQTSGTPVHACRQCLRLAGKLRIRRRRPAGGVRA